MRICVNAWYLRDENLEGIGWFIYQVFLRISLQYTGVEFHFFVSRSFPQHIYRFPKNVTIWRIFPDKRHPFVYVPYMELKVPRVLKKIKPQLFVGPDGIISLCTRYPQISVIHDINFFHRPDDSKWYNRIYYNFFFPRFAHKARRVATVSEFSKRDISAQFKISIDKIDVVYNGIHDFIEPLIETEKSEVREKYADSKNYFVYVGSINPRKNVASVIRAFDLFKKETKADWKLVLAGKLGWKAEEVERAFDQSINKVDILFTGRVENSQLNQLLSAASALVFVPFFEGFGLPIVEAFKCHVPVICSNTTCLPEIAGNAALIVDPNSVSTIAAAMIKIYSEPQTAMRLINKGIEQSKKFSWDRSAALLWNSIESAISDSLTQ